MSEEDTELNRVLSYFFVSYKTKSGRQYNYSFGLATSEKKKLAQSVIIMLGIVKQLGMGVTFSPQRMQETVYKIFQILSDREKYEILTPEQATRVGKNEINNFFLLAQYDNAELTLVNNEQNINMFGPVTLINYGGIIYAVPSNVLNNLDNYEITYSRIMGMIVYMMRRAQQDNIAAGTRMLFDVTRVNEEGVVVYTPYKNIRFDGTNMTELINNIINPPESRSGRTVGSANVPSIQPETGQSEDVRPDANLQLYYTTMRGNTEFVKTHEVLEQGRVTLDIEPESDEVDEEIPELITTGFSGDRANVFSPINEQQDNIRQEEFIENHLRTNLIEVIPESRLTTNMNNLIGNIFNLVGTPSFIRQVAQDVRPQMILNEPLQQEIIEEVQPIVTADMVSGSGFLPGVNLFVDIGPTGFFNNMDGDDDEDIQENRRVENNERIVADVMNNNPLIYKSELLREIYLSFANFVASLYRGPLNIANQIIQDNLTDIDQDTLRDAIAGFINQLDLFVINYPNLTILSTFISVGVTSAIILQSLKYLASLLLNTLGLTTGPSPFVNVDQVIIIRDANGQVLRIIDNGEVNFSPDPISEQTGFQVILEPYSYMITKNIPSRQEVQQAKSTFDNGLYNFIGNRMLSVSKLNMEPTFYQPGYSLLFNISTEIDSLYTSLVQGDKTAIDQFLPKYKQFLVENKEVILNHVNQPYYPGPDPDPDDEDDDISSDSSGSPFPKKPNKFADSKEGEWYIMKTLIYWLMRHIGKIYDYTSVHMQNLFLISQEIASSIFTTIIGRHPYLFTTGIALALLEPQFIPQIYNTFVTVFNGILSITKSVFSFLSSTSGLLFLGAGAFFLLYTFANSNKRFSLF